VVITYGGVAAPSSSGTYAVSASFTSGDSNYTDSVGVGSLIIAKANQTISFAALPTKNMGDPDFTVTAAASSNLPVTFSASGNCSMTGAIVHLIAAGSCTVTAAQMGDANYNSASSVARTFTINAGGDFRIAAKSSAISVRAGQSVIDHLTITPNPSTLKTLTLVCSGLPAQASCTFTPNQVPPGSTPRDVVMTITTTASARAAAMDRSRLFYASWLNISGIGLIGAVIAGARKKSRAKSILGIVTFVVLLISVGCGSSAPLATQGTPSGTSTVTVTATTGTITHSTTLTLTVR
jgi:VCBS repeat-containing protein